MTFAAFVEVWPLLIACLLMGGVPAAVLFALSRIERRGQVRRAHQSRRSP